MEPFVFSSAVARLLSLTIVSLLTVTIGFSLYAVALRLAYERRNRRWARLTEAWEGPVLEALADPETAADLHGLVADDDQEESPPDLTAAPAEDDSA